MCASGCKRPITNLRRQFTRDRDKGDPASTFGCLNPLTIIDSVPRKETAGSWHSCSVDGELSCESVAPLTDCWNLLIHEDTLRGKKSEPRKVWMWGFGRAIDGESNCVHYFEPIYVILDHRGTERLD